ncbi:hypothetical protein, partial [Stutzerimonas nitrititolerans]|uniref:hypothetical protein n=1 Tax=Stutzerimonas nitrititolerans TaxID=2482751 RepID=UPI0028A7F11C
PDSASHGATRHAWRTTKKAPFGALPYLPLVSVYVLGGVSPRLQYAESNSLFSTISEKAVLVRNLKELVIVVIF